MSKVKITFISDTHNKHNEITKLLPGGDLIIHAGDISSSGTKTELENFFRWYSSLRQYEHKVFIAGNHDWGFQDHPMMIAELLEEYPDITYLQDDMYVLGDDYDTAVKIWGSPWQPDFCNWAFNLPRGEALEDKWNLIPNDIDILITHGPAYSRLDKVIGRSESLGCEDLMARINEIKPKIHVCGHIHSGYGYNNNGDTHFFNAAVLNEGYKFTQNPINIEWDSETNEMEIVYVNHLYS